MSSETPTPDPSGQKAPAEPGRRRQPPAPPSAELPPPPPRTAAPIATPGATTQRDEVPDWFERLSLYSLTSALAALLPIPLLDDHLVGVSRRKMVSELAEGHGVALDESELRQLSGTQRDLGLGCVIGLAISITFKIAVKIVRRIFRSILFWLALKDAATAAAYTFHEGYLVKIGLAELQAETSGPPGPARIQDLRRDVEAVLRELDPKPLRRAIGGVLRGSTNLVRDSVRRVRRSAKTRDDDDVEAERLESEVPPALLERLTRTLLAKREYLEEIERRFAARRTQRRQGTAGVTTDGENA